MKDTEDSRIQRQQAHKEDCGRFCKLRALMAISTVSNGINTAASVIAVTYESIHWDEGSVDGLKVLNVSPMLIVILNLSLNILWKRILSSQLFLGYHLPLPLFMALPSVLGIIRASIGELGRMYLVVSWFISIRDAYTVSYISFIFHFSPLLFRNYDGHMEPLPTMHTGWITGMPMLLQCN